MKQVRVYADTSVFGGCFDVEFTDASRAFFNEVKSGRFILVISPTTLRELAGAPEEVREVLSDIPIDHVETIELTKEGVQLRDAYVKAGVVTRASLLDAEHIASASIARVDVVVSWNFKHIVHFDKIRKYNAVNLLHGYQPMVIHTPQEVI